MSTVIYSTLASSEAGEKLVEQNKRSGLSVKVANTLEEREAVFRLGYEVYLDKGYIKPNANQWLIRNYDFDNDTLILIVKNELQEIVGSVTLVFDDSSKLPAEKLYHKELEELYRSGSQITEISRLVIRPDYRNSKEVLLLLMNYLYIYANYIKHYSHAIIEVNPRHKNYYKMLLDFDEIGSEKDYPDVQNAPANLLCASIKKGQTAIEHYNKTQAYDKKERSLYPFFLKPEQEQLVIQYLEKAFKPLTFEEKAYFGYSESGFNSAILRVTKSL